MCINLRKAPVCSGRGWSKYLHLPHLNALVRTLERDATRLQVRMCLGMDMCSAPQKLAPLRKRPAAGIGNACPTHGTKLAPAEASWPQPSLLPPALHPHVPCAAQGRLQRRSSAGRHLAVARPIKKRPFPLHRNMRNAQDVSHLATVPDDELRRLVNGLSIVDPPRARELCHQGTEENLAFLFTNLRIASGSTRCNAQHLTQSCTSTHPLFRT